MYKLYFLDLLMKFFINYFYNLKIVIKINTKVSTHNNIRQFQAYYNHH